MTAAAATSVLRRLVIAIMFILVSSLVWMSAGFAAGVPVTAARLSTFRPPERPPACTGTDSFTAGADSWIDAASPGANHGADLMVHVAAGNGAVRRALVSFTVPATGCAVATATLRLYNVAAVAGRTIDAYRTGAWVESTVTWANQPAAIGTAAPATAAAGWMQWDVTAHVTAMAAEATHGFVLRDAAEGGRNLRQQDFSSRNGANPPELVITWQP